MARRALVTGANGFLGRSLVARLIAEGWDVTRLGRRSAEGTLARPVWDRAMFDAVLAETAPDVVFHLAGTARADSVAALYETNVMLAARLLDAVAARPAPPSVVLIGSAAELGNVAERDQPATEAYPCAPVTQHGMSKLAQTRLGLGWAASGVKVLIARLFNPLGEGMPEHLALGGFAAQIRAGASELRVGNLDVARDFIDVTQAARLIAALGGDPACYGQVVNICSGVATPLRELVEQMLRVAGRRIDILVDPARLRPGEMARLAGDTARLRTAGLAPTPPDYPRLLGEILAGPRAEPQAPRQPGLLDRAKVLRSTANPVRLRRAGAILRRQGIGALLTQARLHTTYRWRLRSGITLEPEWRERGPVVPHLETAWPAEQPLVSIVIPCFNYGAFIAEAVESALVQTLSDLEVIVVEGGSTDATTPDVVRALSHPRLRTLFREGRHLAGDNRNFGIAAARGRYVCCLDADDRLHPTFIEKAVFLIEQYGGDVVSTSVQRFGLADDGYEVHPRPRLDILLEGNHVTTCAVFRRALWEQAGGFQDSAPGATYLHEDWRFWVRLACAGARFRNISAEKLFFYRAHAGGSLSSAPGVRPPAELIGLLRATEAERITPQAFARSRNRAMLRLRAPDGPRNLLARAAPPNGKTLLLAMPFLVLGGAERLLSAVLGGLRAQGYRCIVVTTLPTLPEHGDTTAWFAPATDEIYHLPRFLPEPEWDDFVAYAIAAKGVDTLWIAGSAWFYEALDRLAARFPHLRVVDLLFNTIGHTANNRLHAARIDLTLVENDEVRRWLLQAGETEARIRVIPSGVDLDAYAPRARSRRMIETLGIGPDCFVAGFSGRLSEEKAPLAMAEIARALANEPRLRVVMTGAGPLEAATRRAFAAIRPAGRAHFLGMVEDVRDWLGGYDVLVLPSVLDGRPTVVLEALAMGIPVIASRVGGLPELVRDGETGFLCRPGDIQGFARAIATLIADPARHAAMGVAARMFAEQTLGLDRMVAGYRAALASVVTDLSSPSGE